MATAIPFALSHFDEDPVLAAAFAAPVDDTPESEEERAAVEVGMAEIRAGRWVSSAEIHAMIQQRR